jgi:hypothetical protein
MAMDLKLSSNPKDHYRRHRKLCTCTETDRYQKRNVLAIVFWEEEFCYGENLEKVIVLYSRKTFDKYM